MSRMFLVLALAFAGCSKKSEPAKSDPASAQPAPKATTAPDPASAKKLIGEGAAVVDVRTPEEYAGGHLGEAPNIPVQELPQRIAEIDKLVGGDKAKPVVLYCRSGKRAATAKQALEAAGYTNVVNGGGLDDLQ